MAKLSCRAPERGSEQVKFSHRFARELTDNAPVIDDQHAVAHAEQFLEVRRIEQHAGTVGGKTLDRGIDLRLA